MTMRFRLAIALPLLVAPAFAHQTGAEQAAGSQRERSENERIQQLIRTADEVMAEVEELRGKKFKRPVKKGVHTQKQLSAFIKKKLFEEELGEGKLEAYQWMLADMGFIPKDMDLAQTIVEVLLSQVGGFYDPDRESFFMLEKAANYGESVNRMMIAHELTHALDDQYYGLNALMKARQDEHDASFAIGSVVEGSATALMTRWAQRFGMKKYNMLAEMKEAAKREAEQAEVLLAAPRYFATLVARYLVGMHFLTKGKGQLALARMENGVARNAHRAFTAVPVSSEQILHPEKYWDPAKRDLPVKIANHEVFEGHVARELAAQIVERDTLGEIHVALLARKPGKKLNMGLMTQARYWTNRAARGWGGDRVLLVKRAAARGIVWFTFWDTEKDAGEFELAYTKFHGRAIGFGHARRGRLAVFTYGFARGHEVQLLDLAGRRAELVAGEKSFSLTDA